jgi:hypothetical protein
VEETGELPDERSLYPHISRLAAWMRVQRREFGLGRLKPEKVMHLNRLNMEILLPLSSTAMTSTTTATTTIGTTSAGEVDRMSLNGRFVPVAAASLPPKQPQHLPTYTSFLSQSHNDDRNSTSSNITDNNTNLQYNVEDIDDWNFTFSHLQRFFITQYRLPASVNPNGDAEGLLNDWIETQRSAHQIGDLSKYQIERLNSLSTLILDRVSEKGTLPSPGKLTGEEYVTEFELSGLFFTNGAQLMTDLREIWKPYGIIVHCQLPRMGEAATVKVRLCHSRSAAWILYDIQDSWSLLDHTLRPTSIVSLPTRYNPKT